MHNQRKLAGNVMGCVVGSAVVCSSAGAGISVFDFILEGQQEVPASASDALGVGSLTYFDDTQTFDLELVTDGLSIDELLGVGPNSSPIHIHMAPAGANGPIVVDLGLIADFVDEGFGILSFSVSGVPIGGPQGLVPDSDPLLNEAALFRSELYVNIHTSAFPGGAIRGQIPAPATLAGPAFVGLMAARRRRVRA